MNPPLNLGWKPDVPDQRDHYFSGFSAPASLPLFVDLRPTCPTAFNQFELGSCTANAVAAAMKMNQVIQKKPSVFTASRLYIYYNTRSLEGTINSDSGASIRNTVKSVARWGAPPETAWAYDIPKFKQRAPADVYKLGEQNQAITYQRVNQDLGSVRTCLTDGFPFIFGFAVYESFYNANKSGIVSMPSNTEMMYGGHAVLCVGYNANSFAVNGVPARNFIVHNSWSPRWGVQGRFFMPFEYLLSSDLAADFWTIRQVE